MNDERMMKTTSGVTHQVSLRCVSPKRSRASGTSTRAIDPQPSVRILTGASICMAGANMPPRNARAAVGYGARRK